MPNRYVQAIYKTFVDTANNPQAAENLANEQLSDELVEAMKG